MDFIKFYNLGDKTFEIDFSCMGFAGSYIT